MVASQGTGGIDGWEEGSLVLRNNRVLCSTCCILCLCFLYVCRSEVFYNWVLGVYWTFLWRRVVCLSINKCSSRRDFVLYMKVFVSILYFPLDVTCVCILYIYGSICVCIGHSYRHDYVLYLVHPESILSLSLFPHFMFIPKWMKLIYFPQNVTNNSP